ncbi:MAG: hypothetical protein ACF8K1_13740 [Phycisphaerales bacterium JB047]
MTTQPITTSEPKPFSTDAQEVVRGLRGAFSELLISIGADPSTPGSISEHLGLNKNLAWKISKIIGSDDTAAALDQMPGPPGIKILLKGIEKAKADRPLVQTARDAISEYERLIAVHSGDRATMEMMGSALATRGQKARDEQHRKLLYQGASYVWGAQASTLLKVGVMLPGRTPGCADFATVNAFIDFRRIRPDVTWIMSRRTSSNDDRQSDRIFACEPIDPDFAGDDVAPLIGAFCSDPLPELRRVEDGDAMTFELVEGRVGNTGALTCVAGTIHRDLPLHPTADNKRGSNSARCEIPAELMIVDMLYHKDLRIELPPTVALYSDVGGMSSTHVRTQLQLNEQLIDLGVSNNPAPTPEYPRYRSLIEAVLSRTRNTYNEFHAFRMKIAYPAYPTALEINYPLPEPS